MKTTDTNIEVAPETIAQHRRVEKRVRTLQGLLAEMRKSRIDHPSECSFIHAIEDLIHRGSAMAWNDQADPLEFEIFFLLYEALIDDVFRFFDSVDREI